MNVRHINEMTYNFKNYNLKPKVNFMIIPSILGFFHNKFTLNQPILWLRMCIMDMQE